MPNAGVGSGAGVIDGVGFSGTNVGVISGVTDGTGVTVCFVTTTSISETYLFVP